MKIIYPIPENNLNLNFLIINPLASPCAGAPSINYGDVNTVTPSPGEVKGLIKILLIYLSLL